MMKSMLKDKRGFSLAECIVAIAVILIVSAAAYATYDVISGLMARQWERYEATLDADNALAVFRAVDDLDAAEAKLTDPTDGLGFRKLGERLGETTDGTLVIGNYAEAALGLVSGVSFDDGELTIAFSDGDGKMLVTFRFADEDSYAAAKESITVPNYDYGSYYDFSEEADVWSVSNYTGGLYERRETVLRQLEDGSYQLVDKLGLDGADVSAYAVIFHTGAVAEPGEGIAEPEPVEEPVEYQTKTQYYFRKTNDKCGCIIRVTYSNTSGGASFEAWVVDAGEMDGILAEWRAGTGLGLLDAIKPRLSYRKG